LLCVSRLIIYHQGHRVSVPYLAAMGVTGQSPRIFGTKRSVVAGLWVLAAGLVMGFNVKQYVTMRAPSYSNNSMRGSRSKLKGTADSVAVPEITSDTNSARRAEQPGMVQQFGGFLVGGSAAFMLYVAASTTMSMLMGSTEAPSPIYGRAVATARLLRSDAPMIGTQYEATNIDASAFARSYTKPSEDISKVFASQIAVPDIVASQATAPTAVPTQAIASKVVVPQRVVAPVIAPVIAAPAVVAPAVVAPAVVAPEVLPTPVIAAAVASSTDVAEAVQTSVMQAEVAGEVAAEAAYAAGEVQPPVQSAHARRVRDEMTSFYGYSKPTSLYSRHT